MSRIQSAVLFSCIFMTGCAAQSMCSDPRPEVCTFEYAPVCAVTQKGELYTESNACSACSNPEIVSFTEGACAEK